MLQSVLEIISISCAGLFYAEVSGLNPFDFKPFNCVKCFTFWFALVYHLLFYTDTHLLFDSILYSLLFACTSSILAIYLEKQLQR